jgi:radical SAM protein with 4Fe4S-binding SPASM domain
MELQSERFVPRLISWNLTFKCNLRCAHCYIDAAEREGKEELSTEEGKCLIDQIAEVSKPILILSGGEPLLRKDVFDLARYATERGLKVAMGTNGTLITDRVARQLRLSGVLKVAISLDSRIPEKHDEFRGVKGSWSRAVKGIEACIRNGVDVQVNTTVTQQNYDEIDDIIDLAEKLGVSDFHIFFLVPTGRGKKIEDITPVMYEKMIRDVLEKSVKYRLNIKPTCAPQFMRIARQSGLNLKKNWSRGCIAGLSYCRIYPTGEVTPCPYLPIRLGNIRESRFKDIWFNSEVLRTLRNFDNLKGRCGVCEFREVCGGCRARAYGLTGNLIDVCGGLHEPTELKGDYLAEEPWCTYQPKGIGGEEVE